MKFNKIPFVYFYNLPGTIEQKLEDKRKLNQMGLEIQIFLEYFTEEQIKYLGIKQTPKDIDINKIDQLNLSQDQRYKQGYTLEQMIKLHYKNNTNAFFKGLQSKCDSSKMHFVLIIDQINLFYKRIRMIRNNQAKINILVTQRKLLQTQLNVQQNLSNEHQVIIKGEQFSNLIKGSNIPQTDRLSLLGLLINREYQQLTEIDEKQALRNKFSLKELKNKLRRLTQKIDFRVFVQYLVGDNFFIQAALAQFFVKQSFCTTSVKMTRLGKNKEEFNIVNQDSVVFKSFKGIKSQYNKLGKKFSLQIEWKKIFMMFQQNQTKIEGVDQPTYGLKPVIRQNQNEQQSKDSPNNPTFDLALIKKLRVTNEAKKQYQIIFIDVNVSQTTTNYINKIKKIFEFKDFFLLSDQQFLKKIKVEFWHLYPTAIKQKHGNEFESYYKKHLGNKKDGSQSIEYRIVAFQDMKLETTNKELKQRYNSLSNFT